MYEWAPAARRTLFYSLFFLKTLFSAGKHFTDRYECSFILLMYNSAREQLNQWYCTCTDDTQNNDLAVSKHSASAFLLAECTHLPTGQQTKVTYKFTKTSLSLLWNRKQCLNLNLYEQDGTLSQTGAVYLQSEFLMDPRLTLTEKKRNNPLFAEAVKLHVTLQSALHRYDQNNPQLFIPNELKWGLCLLIFSATPLSLAEHRGCCCFRALEGWVEQASELRWAVRRRVKAANSYFCCCCCCWRLVQRPLTL